MLKVKVISRGSGSGWLRYFPDPNHTQLGCCKFVFNPDEKHYDWLVVYEDLPKQHNQPGKEKLGCNQQNTLLVTTEPPNIKLYDEEYTRQFGHVLTSHPPNELKHPGRIYSQPALMWFCSDTGDNWNVLHQDCQQKSKILSTVCSHKRQKHTLHNRRYDLTMELKTSIPELDIFGRGIQHIDSKQQMMQAYQYHLAIENYRGLHHWTEKLADTYLSCCLPFYYGCTNLADYFPEESYIEIDLWDTQKTQETIKEAIANKAYLKRLSSIKEARRRVLEEYSFFATINKIISEYHQDNSNRGGDILSRHAIRRQYPFRCIPRAIKKEVRQFFNTARPPNPDT